MKKILLKYGNDSELCEINGTLPCEINGTLNRYKIGRLGKEKNDRTGICDQYDQRTGSIYH